MESQLKLLYIQIKGVSTFVDETFTIDFMNRQNASNIGDNEIYPLFTSVFLPTVVGITGINASGKTTALRLIRFVIDYVSGNTGRRIHIHESLCGLFRESILINCIFTTPSIQNQLCYLNSRIDIIDHSKIRIIDESISLRSFSSKVTRSTLFDYDLYNVKLTRDELYKVFSRDLNKTANLKMSIPEDESMGKFFFRSVLDNYFFVSSTAFPNESRLPDVIIPEAIEYLDSSIEYLKLVEKKENEVMYDLKFKLCKEAKIVSAEKLPQYLSSGTIRGLRIFSMIKQALATGAYLIVDEIETSLHRSLNIDMIKIFTSKRMNPRNATLIFSTHTPELLDTIRRVDSVFVVSKVSDKIENDNYGKIQIQNLTDYMTRNDLKKSEALQSAANGLMTLPDYEKSVRFQEALIGTRRSEKES